MPYYADLDETNARDQRTAQRLLLLKDRLDDEIPQRTIDNLLLATWNIREFDSESYGARSREPLLYMAEIISRFDLVAVQEVREDLEALNRLRHYLGRWWEYVLTDITEGRPGNRERMAFLFDSRKVNFGGLAGEIVIPPSLGGDLQPAEQLARTPFIVGFRVGWFAFTICTTHILYGEEKAEDPRRLKEIQLLAEFLAKRASEKHAWAPTMIMLGDFNIFSPKDKTMEAITAAGFEVPVQLQEHPSNAPRTKHYDQIAFITKDLEDQLAHCRAGAFNYFDTVYTMDDEPVYEGDMGESYQTTSKGAPREAASKKTYYRSYWRTYQMSDHLPMWIELQTDFSRRYLSAKRAGETPVEDDAPSMLRNIL